MLSRRPPNGVAATAPPPSPPGGAKIAMGMEDDPNFSKLPVRDRELHLFWGTAQARNQTSLGDNLDMLMDCVEQAMQLSKTKVIRSGTRR
jgi:hypothetical protein